MGFDREKMRQALLDSYKHRNGEGHACVMCGSTSNPLAFHVFERYFNDGDALPAGFVKLSSARGRIKGSYPVCIGCAPPCPKCNLPIPTEDVLEFGETIDTKYGLGICQHMHLGLFLQAVYKRIFKVGRFKAG